MRYNVLPQNEFKNIQLDSSLGAVAPKKISSVVSKAPVTTIDLSNIDNHLISIPASSNINNAPKDNIFSILGQPHIPTNLADLNKFENHLSGIQQAEKVNNLSSQVGAALSHNKFNHLKQLAAQSKY